MDKKGLTRLGIILLISLILVSAIFGLMFVVAEGTRIWTTDSAGIPKSDYAPSETVYISGEGFAPETDLTVEITRPNGVESCSIGFCDITRGDGSLIFPEGPLTSDEEGSFFDYPYLLNGDTGEYTININDGINPTATTTFTDSRNINWVTLDGGAQWEPAGWVCCWHNNAAPVIGDSVTVNPGDSITVEISVRTSGSSSEDDWRCTSWDIEGTGNNGNDDFEPDYTSDVNNAIESFTITAPSTPGTYDVSFVAYNDDGCSSGASSTFTLTNAITVTSPAVCGDGTTAPPEVCDDSNTANCDGCKGDCSRYDNVCGDGIIECGEGCDDSNTNNDDGCSSSCTIEQGWQCTGQPSVCTTINPTLSSSCGIDMVLIMDKSSSIDGTELSQMKTAFKGFVDAFLPTTPTQIAVVEFGTIGDLTLDYNNDATTIKNAIDSVSTVGTQYTNWDDGLKEAQDEFDNSAKPDLYIFASDGNPNKYSDPAIPSGSGQDATNALAAAITRANAIKLSGVRIITLGIGNDLNTANLIAISSADALYTGNFDTLASTLAALADDLCGGTITVKKLVDGQPASGWTFTVSGAATSTPTSSTTDGSGFINPVFDITNTPTTATVTESLQGGYGFVSANCYDGQTEVGTPGTETVTDIPVGTNDAIYCEFHNTYFQCQTDNDCSDGQYCNGAETCNHETHTCQAGTQIDCSTSSDECNIGVCDETSDQCVKQPKQDGTTCDGSPSGDCDLQDTCQSGQCIDNVQPDTHVCKPSAGVCDLDDYCNGLTKDCPTDLKSTAVCRPAANAYCDIAESCDGTNDDCPADAFQPAGTNCEQNQLFCQLDQCDGSGNCVLLGQMDCSKNDISEIAKCDNDPDGYHPTWDYGAAFTSTCDEEHDTCTIGTQTITHTCDKLQCGAICEQNSDCNNKCEGNVWYNTGICLGDCTCTYSQTSCADQFACTIDSCDAAAGCLHTPNNAACDDSNPCTIDSCQIGVGCVNTFSDTTGPITSNVVVDPYYNNGIFNLTARTEDTCSVIKTAQYFVGPDGYASCDPDAPVKGTIYPADDGSFNLDKLIENLLKSKVIYKSDGVNWACVNASDNAGNSGNCECVYFETDVLPPDCPYDIYLDNQLYPNEYLICGNDAKLNATVCDSESQMQGGEYFLNRIIPPVPAPWSGSWLDLMYRFERGDGWHCGLLSALMNTSGLNDGTHYIRLRGKDTAENWGKISECRTVSFIRDTTAPKTEKTLNPAGGAQVSCDIQTANGSTITDGCNYVKQGTTIDLIAHDYNPNNTYNGGYNNKTGQYSDAVIIKYRVYWRLTDTDPWVLDQSGQSSPSLPITITLSKDSYHLIEYWAVDACGYEETHHFELDIVDTQKPVTTKNIIGPQYNDTIAGKFYIDGATEIELTCVDPDPHPVDHVEIFFRYKVDGGDFGDWKQYNGTLIKFPEESMHTFEFYCKDALGNEEVHQTEIDYVDHTPPTTTKDYGTPYVTHDGKEWITSATPITLTADDGTSVHASGVKETKYRVTKVNDGDCASQTACDAAVGSGAWNTYTGPFTKPEQSCHLIEYYSVDNVDKTETVKKQCVYVENTAPVSSKTLIGEQHACETGETLEGITDCWYITQDTEVKLKCTDPSPHPVDQVKIKYKIDWKNLSTDSWTEGSWIEDGSQVTFKYKKDSYHRLTWYCLDALGNTESQHIELDIVDTEPPESKKGLGDPKHECTQAEQDLYYSGMPAQTDGCYFITSNTPISIKCADKDPHPVDHVKLYYRNYLVGETAPSFTEVLGDYVQITKTPDSAHVLEWYCVDALGNTESTHVEYDIVDTQPPATVKTISNPKVAGDNNPINWYITKDTTIDLTCTDGEPHPVDHVTLSWDVYQSESCDTPTWTEIDGGIATDGHKIITGLSDSCHKIVYHCVDVLGTAETEKIEIDAVDNQAPSIVKTIDGPSYGTCPPRPGTSDVCFIDGRTLIHVESTDPQPHPVDDVKCDWSYTVNGGSVIIGGTNLASPFDINFPEESTHELTITCRDSLGNSKTDVETFQVDKTAPTTTKTYGTPAYPIDINTAAYPHWITSQTPITLTVDDTGIHKSGIKETKYSVTQVADSYCLSQSNCQNAVGSGIWNTYTAPFTIADDSCHLIEYYSVDNVDKTETTKRQCVYVDNKAPVGSKVIGAPKIPCTVGQGCDYWLKDKVSEITLDCVDPQPHPVDHEKMCYKISFDDPSTPYLTTQYCTQFGGVMEGDYCCADVSGTSKYTFKFQEDSLHDLEYKCVDALGNQNQVDVEYFRVDSIPPESEKTFEGPTYPEDLDQNGIIEGKQEENYWVTSSTQITLTAIDKQDPCAVGVAKFHVKIEWDSNCDGTVDKTQFNQDIPSPYQYTFTLHKECLHKITWYAVDKLGNVEAEHVQYHKVDDNPPHLVILKPVDGWYSDGEDIAIVAQAEDLNSANGSCERRTGTCDVIGIGISCGNPNDCNGLGTNCAVGIEDGTQCNAYLLDVEDVIDKIRDKKIPMAMLANVSLITDGTLLYNAETKQCEGYATMPLESGILGGVKILVVSVNDSLGNAANSLDEIGRAINERCGCDVYDMCETECIRDVLQDIITIWNLPKIGIDNQDPTVTITRPVAGTLIGNHNYNIEASVSDSTDGDITSTITSGTPCYVYLGDVELGVIPYSNENRKCEGSLAVPSIVQNGVQDLKVRIADNAGNIGEGKVSVNVDTVSPVLDIIIPSENQFVSGTLQVTAQVTDANLDASSIRISTDNGQSWKSVTSCGTDLYCYNWNTALETDGMAYGLMAIASDLAGNIGFSEIVAAIVDNGLPESVAIIYPYHNQYLTGPITIEAVTGDAVSGIEIVSFYKCYDGYSDPSHCWLIGQDSSSEGGWTVPFDACSSPSTTGLYAQASDFQGNELQSTLVPVTVDCTPPEAPILYVIDPDGDGYDTDGTLTFEWTPSYDAGSGVDYYVISISGPGGIYTKILGTTFTISDLIDGTWHAKVKAVDKVGHESVWSNEVEIIVDKYAPSVVTLWATDVENPIYDTGGSYVLWWSGGNDDPNFDRYELYENGISIYSGSDDDFSIDDMPEGSYRYQVIAYDLAGHSTASSFFDVFVDTITPQIEEESQSSWGPVGWWFEYSVDDGASSSGLLTPTYGSGLKLCSWDPDAKTGNCLVFGGTSSITVNVQDKAGHANSLMIYKGVNTDFTAPELLTTAPSGLIKYNNVILTATTDEPAVCYYGDVDDLEDMNEMENDDSPIEGYGTSHSVDLGTLPDGLYVYHVRCEDIAGNMMEHSKTVVFVVNIESQYCYSTELKEGWNTFFLPQLILDDINFNCGQEPYETGQVLASLNGNYDIVWYYDEVKGWLFYNPEYPQYSSLTEFNDQVSNPYFIKMNNEDRLELECEECVCGNGIVEGNEDCDWNDENGIVCTPPYSLSGELCQYCSETCNLINILGEYCGDGILNGPEECDDGANNGQPNYCNSQCTGITTPVCGNGIIEQGEQCDGGSAGCLEGYQCDQECVCYFLTT